MSSSPTSKSKRDHVLITTTELQDADSDHSFPKDATKSVLPSEITSFQELLLSKTLESQTLNPSKARLSDGFKISQGDKTHLQARPTVKQMLTQGLNPTNSMFNAEPFTPSSKGPCFANSSQAIWYQATSPLLSKVLSTAKYPPHLHDQYLFFFNHSILPALGPIPSPSNKWTPRLTHTSSPFSPSLKLSENKQAVRFTIEPIGPLAGTPSDSFNQSLPLALVSSLASANICPTLNLQWWSYFTHAFFISPSKMAAIPSLLAGVKVHPTCFLAFDLPNTEFAPVLRAYLFPHRTAGLGEMSTAVTVFEAVRHLPSPTHEILPVLGKIEAFLSAHQDNSVGQLGLQNSRRSGGELKARGLSVEMLSFDCVDPSTARIKIYAKTHDTSFISVKNAFTLGGQLNSSGTAEGLKALEEFWRCLMLLREDWDDDEDQSAEFLYFGFEIAPGRNDPDIKLYVPSWTCGIDKTGLTRGLSKYFKEKGWSVASSYKSDIREIFGGEGQERAGYRYISFGYGRKGPSVTVYCSPKFPSL